MKAGWKSGFAAMLLVPLLLDAQGGYGRRRNVSPGSSGAPGAYQGVVVTFHGKLKDRDKQKIELETDENQLVSIRISGKTKFFKDGKAIKPSEISLDTPVSIDASEDRDLSVLAVKVTVDAPGPKGASQ